jgi:F-type H+-transporting ATPase subunit epsilon
MASIHVEIVTPTRVVFTGEADEVRAPGFQGEFGVLPGHTPFLSVVVPGVVTLTTAGSDTRYVVGQGFVEAGPDRVVVLTQSVQMADDVDTAAAAALLEESEKKLASEDPSTADWALAERNAQLARARLSL